MLVKKTDYNAKITEIEDKIPSISGLATKTALTAVEDEIPNIGSLVKKTDYNTKIAEIEKKITDQDYDKYINTPQFNDLNPNVVRLAQAHLVTKTSFDNGVSSLDSKITVNKRKDKSIENELKKLKTFDSIYFRGKSHFEEDGTENYLVLQPRNRYFKVIANSLYISEWKSKRLSDESIKPTSTSDNSLSPLVNYYGSKII